MTRFKLIDLGGSVPEDDPLRALAQEGAEATLVIGGDAEARARAVAGLDLSAQAWVLVELGTECLGYYAGEGAAAARNVVGFSRFRLGALPCSPLVEVVRSRATSAESLAAVRAVFDAAGQEVAVCTDAPGRIVDALLRPYLNLALRSVDEGLAPAADMDQVLRLGLGLPKGPIELVEASGVAAHFQVTSELYEALGDAGFVPARRARVQAMRGMAGLD